MPALEATFVRTAGRDAIFVHRSDTTEVSWRFPTYGSNLPHDLIHLVVESGFGLAHGFWGRVDAGADPARINHEANRPRPGTVDRYAGFGPDRDELLAAEGLAAVSWFDAALDDADLCEAVHESCARFGVAAPNHVCPERVAAVRAALAEVRRAWRDQNKVVLRFDARDPEDTVDRLADEAARRSPPQHRCDRKTRTGAAEG